MNHCQGLTLIEVMIAVAILAIAASISIPMFMHFGEVSRTKLAAETFYNDVTRARSEALKNNANTAISIITGANWCYGATTAASCDCNSAGACNLGQVRSTNYKGAIDALTATDITTLITFDGERGFAQPSGTVTFTSGAGAISVVVTPAGSAQVCSSDFGDYQPC